MQEQLEFISTSLKEIGVEFERLEDTAKLEDDLGMESLMRLELAAKLQKKYGKPVTDHVDAFETVGDILSYLQQ